jgi:hypothetical protein
MFRNTSPASEPAPVDEADPVDLIPLSVLALDLPEPATGWEPFLTVRNIAVVVDDVGRDSITRADARTLIAEKHENERRAQEVAARNEQRMIEADRLRFARLGRGIPAGMIPEGMTGAAAMLLAEHESRPPSVREQLLEAELGGSSNSMVYQPFPQDEDAAS